MKLKITLLALAISFSLSTMAQHYTEDYIIKKGGNHPKSNLDMVYGVMVGVTAPVLSDKSDKLNVKNTAGYEAGIMWGIDLGGLEIVPEIWYQHDKSLITNSETEEAGDLVTNAIEVPIIFAIGLGPLRINVGPSFSLMSSSKFKVEGEERVDFGRTKSTAGYVVGVSATLLEHFILDARYTGRFVSTSTPWYNGYNDDEHYDYRYYSFGFNIGYRF